MSAVVIAATITHGWVECVICGWTSPTSGHHTLAVCQNVADEHNQATHPPELPGQLDLFGEAQ